MGINKESYQKLIAELGEKHTLVAVSKTKPVEDILALYKIGQRDFGENYVQEMVAKAGQLPRNIRWHFIGHLQTNKVKFIAPFVHLIQGMDRLKLLKEIDKEAAKNKRILDVLLQVHIAQEETKFGLDEEELDDVMISHFANVRICGLMGMASLTDNLNIVRNEFRYLKSLFDKYAQQYSSAGAQTPPNTDARAGINPVGPDHPGGDERFTASFGQILSMGMSSDYKIAIEEGSNMVRIGSLIFGERD